ncbi:MAG: Thioesterase superfamily [Chloroflexi bacterium]|jgi:fluoroacetyl-CoA thioesterase|nr:Thioesterase superfamily [Chloroflexota bacterium]
MEGSKLQPGITGEATTQVTAEMTANRIASGVVEVYATPMMIALMEKAAAEAVQPHLAAGQSTVGTLVNITHIAATPVGQTVKAKAELLEVDGRRLIFAVTAYDEMERIGEGRHERFIIDDDRFLNRVARKGAQKLKED